MSRQVTINNYLTMSMEGQMKETVSTPHSSIQDDEEAPLLGQKRVYRACGVCRVLREVKAFFVREDGESGHAVHYHSLSLVKRALLFLPALQTTTLMELVNTTVLSVNSAWLQEHLVLLLFIPVISAVAGNVGLQTSSSVTAFGQSADGIAVRRSCKDTSEWVGRMFQKYFWSNLLNSSIISMQLFMIVAVADKTECKWPHAFIIACGAMVNMLIGNLMGILSPTLAGDVCRLDPSAFAGPLETALQDVVGFTIFMGMAAGIISLWGSCDIGSCLVMCEDKWDGECITGCNATYGCVKELCMQ